MTTKTIKGVDEKVWNEFKGLAASNGQSMGQFFTTLVQQQKKIRGKLWDEILNAERITREDAEAVVSVSKEVRSKRGFR